MQTRARRPWLSAFALYATAAVAATWPLASQLSTHLPLGTLNHATVPLFNLWTLEWNAHSLWRGYRGYWDAPIFYPTQAAFALSEAQALTGLGYAALERLFGSIAAYNSVILAMLVANGLGARRLFRVLGVSELGALLGGLLALGLPFAWKELGVLQLLALWPVWLSLAELALLSPSRADAPRPTAAAPWRLALWCGALLWTCGYYALFFAVFALLAAAMFVRRALFARPLVRSWLLGTLLLVASAAPFIAQQRAVDAYTRSAKAIYNGSATALSYTRLLPGALAGQVVPTLARREAKRSLAPGILVVALAIGGACSVRAHPRRRFLIWCGASAALALVLSFGTRWWIGSIKPYELIVERYWPGFSHVRSPYRFAAFVQVFVLVFAVLGLERLRQARVRPAGILPLVAAIAAFLEVLPAPPKLARFPAEAMQAPFIDFLAKHPGGAVAMLPTAPSGKAPDYEPTVVAMLQSLRHGHPLLNGYSGFFPRKVDMISDAMRQFPTPRTIRLLQRVPVRFAVVDKAWLGTRAPPLERVFDSATHVIYSVPELGR
jgi:hypothetical protein